MDVCESLDSVCTETLERTSRSDMSGPVVSVKQGDLRGIEAENVRGGSYLSFRGIPYATPPVGDLRFRVRVVKNLVHECRASGKSGFKLTI